MEYIIGNLSFDPDYLEHHGILGQKWYIRRFQNKDGTLTEEGKKRYGIKNGTSDGEQALRYVSKNLKKKGDRTVYTDPFSALYGNREKQHELLEAGRRANEQEAAGIDKSAIAHDFAKKVLGDYADVKISDVVKLPADKKHLANETLAWLIDMDQEQMMAAAKIDTSGLSEAQKANFEQLVTIPSWALDREIREKSGDWYDSKGVSIKFKRFLEDRDEAENAYRNSDEKYDMDKQKKALTEKEDALTKRYTGKYVDSNGNITDIDAWNKAYDKYFDSSDYKKISQEFREIYRKDQALENDYLKDYSNEKLCEIVLKDLGFTPSKAAIEYIMPIVIWD